MIHCPTCDIAFSPSYAHCPRCKAFVTPLDQRAQYLRRNTRAWRDANIPPGNTGVLLAKAVPEFRR